MSGRPAWDSSHCMALPALSSTQHQSQPWLSCGAEEEPMKNSGQDTGEWIFKIAKVQFQPLHWSLHHEGCWAFRGIIVIAGTIADT